jgi:hypothetical protein
MRALVTWPLVAALAFVLAGGTASAQPAAGGLSMAKIEALLKLKTPDATVAGEIGRRGLAFTPDARTVPRLKALGAGPLTLAAVEARRPILDDAREQVPAMLEQLYEHLDGGDLQRARAFVGPELAGDGRKLDSICKPFTYRAHYVEAMVERPGRVVEARVRVLFRPATEAAYVLVLRAPGGQWQVQDVLPPPDDWFAPLVTGAQDLARKFVYALKAGREEVLAQLVSGASVALLTRGRCGEAVQGMGDVARESAGGARDAKGLKAVAHVTMQRGAEWRFFVEPVDGEPRIVRLETDLRGCQAAEDPGLEARTLRRFGLEKEATAAATAAAPSGPSAGLDTRSTAALQQEALAALRAGDEPTAYGRWDEVLQAGGTLSFPACREGSGFGKCALGALSLSASELKFVESTGAALFALKPAAVPGVSFDVSKVAFTPHSVGRLKLKIGPKGQNFNPLPEASNDCERSKFYECTDDSPGLAQQSAIGRYLARTIERMVASGGGTTP